MTTEQQNIPRAVLYSWPSSVWSTVPRLCLYEKGYSEDEYIVKYVDISKCSSSLLPSIEADLSRQSQGRGKR